MKTHNLILFKNKLSGIKFFFFGKKLSFCDLFLVSQSGLANVETIENLPSKKLLPNYFRNNIKIKF